MHIRSGPIKSEIQAVACRSHSPSKFQGFSERCNTRISTVLELQVYLSQVLHLFKMSFIDGSPSIFLSLLTCYIDGSHVNNKGTFQRNRWSTCNRYTCTFQDCSRKLISISFCPNLKLQYLRDLFTLCTFGTYFSAPD